MTPVIITPDILSWPHFHSEATLRCLLYIWINAGQGTITLSVRALAKEWGTSYKTIRCAIRRLEKAGLIATTKQGALTTITPTTPKPPFAPIKLYRGALLDTFRAHPRAQLGRTDDTTETPINKEKSNNSETTEGRTRGAGKGALDTMRGAHSQNGAQLGRTDDTTETPINKEKSNNSETTEGRTRGAVENSRVGKENKEKKKSPHTPLIKEKNTKEKDEKKIKRISIEFFENLKSFFNETFKGTCVPQVIKINEPRQQAVLNFIDDFSKKEITELLTRVRNTPRCINGRTGKVMTFDTIFDERNYMAIMEGAWNNPALNRPKKSDKPKAQLHTPAEADTPDTMRANLLKQYAMVPPTSPAYKHVVGILKSAYLSGEIQQLGIDWKPEGQSQQQTAAEILNKDPNGYLASIINPH